MESSSSSNSTSPSGDLVYSPPSSSFSDFGASSNNDGASDAMEQVEEFPHYYEMGQSNLAMSMDGLQYSMLVVNDVNMTDYS